LFFFGPKLCKFELFDVPNPSCDDADDQKWSTRKDDEENACYDVDEHIEEVAGKQVDHWGHLELQETTNHQLNVTF